jgi:hypothetical protein
MTRENIASKQGLRSDQFAGKDDRFRQRETTDNLHAVRASLYGRTPLVTRDFWHGFPEKKRHCLGQPLLSTPGWRI